MRRTARSGVLNSILGILFVGCAIVAIPGAARAQDSEKGRAEYLANCAGCHGADGRGHGRLGADLPIKPPDLTKLAKNNHGVFAAGAVYQLIDGRQAKRPHGSADMPIWGCRHTAPPVVAVKKTKRKSAHRPEWKKLPEPAIDSLLDLPCGSEAAITERLLSIVEYLSLIQER